MAKNEHTDPKAKPAEEQKRRDPHGTAPARQAGRDEPTGTPTADRHATETAAEPKKPGR